MFDVDGVFQRYLADHAKPFGIGTWVELARLTTLMLPFDLAFFNALRLISAPLSFGSNATKIANVLNAASLARKNYREGIQHTYQERFPEVDESDPINGSEPRQKRLAVRTRENDCVPRWNRREVLLDYE